jgi:5-methylcytosine-specific restriction endonuclease McrA
MPHKNPEDRKAWYERNKEKYKAYYRANIEKIEAYREANKERMSVYSKMHYKANREKILAKKMAYRKVNKEKRKTYMKSYNEANRGKINAYARTYQANKQKNNCIISSEDKQIATWIYTMSSKLSEITDIKWEVDHIRPLSKGGTHSLDNLQIVPATWNRAKQNFNEERWNG